MTRRLATTYSMLGYNDRITPTPPPPSPEPELEPEPSDIFALDLYEAELMERVLPDAKFEADPEQAAILESCQLAHGQRNAARTLEQVDQQLLKWVMAFTRKRLPTEEARRLLMEAERQRLFELNARALAEETRREDERRAMSAESSMRR
jgi:hypothetical protein